MTVAASVAALPCALLAAECKLALPLFRHIFRPSVALAGCRPGWPHCLGGVQRHSRWCPVKQGLSDRTRHFAFVTAWVSQ
jgi:hypothetical protein